MIPAVVIEIRSLAAGLRARRCTEFRRQYRYPQNAVQAVDIILR